MYRITPHSLRVVRSNLNLTQRNLADLIGVSRSYIAYLELGQRSMTYGIQERLQDALGWNTPETQVLVAAVEAFRR